MYQCLFLYETDSPPNPVFVDQLSQANSLIHVSIGGQDNAAEKLSVTPPLPFPLAGERSKKRWKPPGLRSPLPVKQMWKYGPSA